MRPITLKFATEFIKATDLPSDIQTLNGGQSAVFEEKVYHALPGGLIRKQSIDDVQYHPLITISDKSITVLDWKTPQSASSFDESQNWAWAASDGETIAYGIVENKVNSFSGEITQSSQIWKHSGSDSNAASIIGIMLAARDQQIQTLDDRGRVVQWHTSSNDELTSGLSHRSLSGSESTATLSEPLIGRSTMMIASDSGHIESVAVTASDGGQELLSIHRFGGDHGSILDIVSAPESRVVAGAFSDGQAVLYYVPTNSALLPGNCRSQRTPAIIAN